MQGVHSSPRKSNTTKKVAICNVPAEVVEALARDAQRETLSVSDIGRRIWMRYYGLLQNAPQDAAHGVEKL